MTTPLPELQLLRDSFADRPAFGTAVSEAILQGVAAGELAPTLRLHRPGRELALSKQDASSPGFAAAIAAGRSAGFEPVLRLAGGRAAAFHEGTIALSMATPGARIAADTQGRFERTATAIAQALRSLGVDARVGEVPGEYCPGAWSVNARGATKLVGIGQRMIAGGAHVGVVVVVDGAEALRDLLVPVYEALDLEWDPATVGSVAQEIGEIALETVEEAILAEVAKSWRLVPGELGPEVLERAERLEPGRIAA